MVMRRRGSRVVRPFDLIPPSVIEAAKRIFTLVWGNGDGQGLPADSSGSPLSRPPQRSRLSDQTFPAPFGRPRLEVGEGSQ